MINFTKFLSDTVICKIYDIKFAHTIIKPDDGNLIKFNEKKDNVLCKKKNSPSHIFHLKKISFTLKNYIFCQIQRAQFLFKYKFPSNK